MTSFLRGAERATNILIEWLLRLFMLSHYLGRTSIMEHYRKMQRDETSRKSMVGLGVFLSPVSHYP